MYHTANERFSRRFRIPLLAVAVLSRLPSPVEFLTGLEVVLGQQLMDCKVLINPGHLSLRHAGEDMPYPWQFWVQGQVDAFCHEVLQDWRTCCHSARRQALSCSGRPLLRPRLSWLHGAAAAAEPFLWIPCQPQLHGKPPLKKFVLSFIGCAPRTPQHKT